MIRIAIIGRPNVGKSTLFNRICGTRRAIVGDEPGITRDRLYGTAVWRGRKIEVIDTGGLVVGEHETIPAKIFQQAQKAISEARYVLFIVDGRTGPAPLDEQLLPYLRKCGRPVWVVVNKIDAEGIEPMAAAFHVFGFPKLFPISAEHNIGVGDLLDAVIDGVDEGSQSPAESEETDEIAVAVVGRPNVGKSSLVNRLLGVERAIVSDVPGTTRDAVDTTVEREGVRYRIIDTAGIRRKGKTDLRTEKISVIMARKHLEEADVALLLLDAEEGVTKLDAAIGGYAEEAGCSVIIVANKWDKVERDTHTIEAFTQKVHRRMKYLQFAPLVSISALTGQRVSKLFEIIRNAQEGRNIRITTGSLNHLFVPDMAADFKRAHPAHHLEIRYVTQAETRPPTFVVFTSGKDPLHFSTERYIQNCLREKFGFYATPIRIRQRTRKPRTSKSQ
jgi:GTPase